MGSPLAIYLRNHEAGGQAGRDLFRRAARSQRGKPHGDELAALAEEVKTDLESLHTVMTNLGISPDPVQILALKIGEKVGRLKPNGQLLGRAPLSELIELEGMLNAVQAKGAGWRALSAAQITVSGVDLDELITRADDQRDRLRSLHHQVSAHTLTTPRPQT